MFSPVRIVLLVLLAFAVWLGFRFWKRLQQAEGRVSSERRGKVDRSAPRVDLEEMTPCRVCGTYMSQTRPARCARADCPY